MTNTALNNALRNRILKDFIEFVSQKYNLDALTVSSSAVAFPMEDDEGNEKYAKVTVSIPRGTRNGKGGYDEYDGEEKSDEYKAELKRKEDKRKASEAKKQAKIKADQAKREAKKVVKELNQKGLDGMIHETDNPN